MTPDKISKLPPELQLVAELCESTVRVAGAAEYVYASLIWGLQMQEERDAAIRQRNTGADFCLDVARILGKFCPQDGVGMNPREIAETAEATIATLTRERDEANEAADRNSGIIDKLQSQADDDKLAFDHAQEVVGAYEAQLSRIAETVAKLPSITGLQEGCVKDHSLIWMAIRDAQDAYRDTLKRHQKAAERERTLRLAAEKERDIWRKAMPQQDTNSTDPMQTILNMLAGIRHDLALNPKAYSASVKIEEAMQLLCAALSHTPEGGK